MHHALAFLEILMIFFMTPQTAAADTGHSFFDFYLAQKGGGVFHLYNDNTYTVGPQILLIQTG